MGSDNDLSDGTPSLVDASRHLADKYLVPDGPVRDLLMEVAKLYGGKLDGFELSVISSVYRHLHEEVREVYRPRSPLDAQLGYEKARKELEAQGIRTPAWTEDDTAFIADRWERWRADGP